MDTANRVIGTIRRECLDHVIVLDEKHLRRVLKEYLAYYHESRTHLGLGQGCAGAAGLFSHHMKGPSSVSPSSVDCITATIAKPLRYQPPDWAWDGGLVYPSVVLCG